MLPVKLIIAKEETIAIEDDLMYRRTGALLPPKEKWSTSPELLELDANNGIEGRQYLPDPYIPSSYDARDFGKF